MLLGATKHVQDKQCVVGNRRALLRKNSSLNSGARQAKGAKELENKERATTMLKKLHAAGPGLFMTLHNTAYRLKPPHIDATPTCIAP
jgi:hypothetical protein